MTLLRPITLLFLVMTVAVFLGPVALLAAPSIVPVASSVVSGLAALLVIVQVVGLGVVTAILVRVPLPGRFATHAVLGAVVLAVADAACLAAGVQGGGLGGELAGAVWLAAPLALWWLASGPALRALDAWWARPLFWMSVALSLAFLLAGLSRVDFRTYTGVPTPPAVAWLFAYGPTLLAVGAGLGGSLACLGRRASAARIARTVAVPLGGGTVAGLLMSANPEVTNVVSATITWGSGYQLFRTAEPLPPLAGAFILVMLSLAAYLAVLVRARREGRIPLLLALAAVLSGVYANPVSVLGSLLALQLLWLVLTRAGAPPARGHLDASASGVPGTTPPQEPAR